MKKILCILSEYGYWGEELVEPLRLFDNMNYEVTFATPRGNFPNPVPVSMDPSYVDPPLGREVVSDRVADDVKKINESDRLKNPLNINELMPGRPYLSVNNFLHRLEGYYHELEKVKSTELDEYDALLMVGGSGPIIDMANSQRLHDIILAFHENNRLIAAECYATAALIFARDPRSKYCILKGKRVTGHPIEYDYNNDYGFVGLTPGIHEVPYPLEYLLRDAIGQEGEFFGNVGNTTSVILDGHILTSRSTASSLLCGEVMIKNLEEGLTRFGW